MIAGAPRSGTTWLAELVQGSLPGAAVCFEPLHLRHVPAAERAGFFWDTYLRPERELPDGEAFMDEVLRGNVVNAWTASHAPTHRCWRPHAWIVKFVRANLMLGWLQRRFGIRTPALIMRHPCATVASQLHLGWKLEHEPAVPTLYREYPRMGEYVRSLQTPVQFLAAHWCILQWAPLSLPRPHPFHLLTYEALVRDGRGELGRLLGAWGREAPTSLQERLDRPSLTTGRTAAVRRGADRLRGWQGRLPAEDVRAVLDVVRAFGLDFYDESPEPDYERLLRGPTPREDWT